MTDPWCVASKYVRSIAIAMDRSINNFFIYRRDDKILSRQKSRKNVVNHNYDGTGHIPLVLISIFFVCHITFQRAAVVSAFSCHRRTRSHGLSQIQSTLHHGRKGRVEKDVGAAPVSKLRPQHLIWLKVDESADYRDESAISGQGNELPESNQANIDYSEEGNLHKSKETTNSKKLSKQEEIIASLGLGEVETEEEKAKRIAKREAALRAQESEKQNNILLALASVSVALLQFIWQFTHPVTAIQLLSEMQRESPPVSVIGQNGKPSVVDFWAPWCENCKASAPTLFEIEQEFGSKINFIMINGDEDSSWDYIEAFGVDAIPHLALVSSEGDVETALIGPVPASVLRTDFNTLLENASKSTKQEKKPLPYVMYDAFRTNPEKRRVSFVDGISK